MVTTEWPTNETPFAAPFVKRQRDKLQELGVDVDIFHFYGGGNPINYLKAQKKISQQIKNNNYDLAHAQWGQSVIPLLPKKIPIVITYRGDDLEGIYDNNKEGYGVKSLVLKIIGKWVARYADHTILVSNHMLNLFKPYSAVDIIPSGIDFSTIPNKSKLELRKELSLPENKKIIIFPNKPSTKRKNFKLVESVFKHLSKDDKTLYLHVINGLTHKEILKHIKASDFLFFASFHEGSPNIVKEAIACDTPIVSVPVADVPFRLNPIPGCFVCQDYSVESFLITAQKALQYDYSTFNYRPFVADLDENILAKRIYNIYKNILIKK